MPNTDAERMEALLEKHADDGCGDCICSEYVLDVPFRAHVAAALVEAGVGFVAEAEQERLRGLADMYLTEYEDAFARAERAEAALAAEKAQHAECDELKGQYHEQWMLTQEVLDRVRALADEWLSGIPQGADHVVHCRVYDCPDCVVAACNDDLRALLNEGADQ